MVSPDLTKTEVQVDRGRAEIEVDVLYKQNDLLVDQGPAQTKILKNGLYEFDANASNMRVFDGEAAVSPSQTAKKWINVKSHHELALNGDLTKPQDFNPEQAANQDPLYSWSKLRADYLGQANLALAKEYAGNEGFYPGWYWAPGTLLLHLAARRRPLLEPVWLWFLLALVPLRRRLHLSRIRLRGRILSRRLPRHLWISWAGKRGPRSPGTGTPRLRRRRLRRWVPRWRRVPRRRRRPALTSPSVIRNFCIIAHLEPGVGNCFSILFNTQQSDKNSNVSADLGFLYSGHMRHRQSTKRPWPSPGGFAQCGISGTWLCSRFL